MIKLHVDGGCKGNSQLDPRERKIVSVVWEEKTGLIRKRWLEGFLFEKGVSNNVAEILAIYDAVKFSVEELMDVLYPVEIYTDSQVAIHWLKEVSNKKINNYELVKEISDRIKEMRKGKSIEVKKIGREENLAGKYIEEEYDL